MILKCIVWSPFSGALLSDVAAAGATISAPLSVTCFGDIAGANGAKLPIFRLSYVRLVFLAYFSASRLDHRKVAVPPLALPSFRIRTRRPPK